MLRAQSAKLLRTRVRPMRSAVAAHRPKPLSSPSRTPRALGNQTMGQLLQAKLTISQPGDKYECEADRVADQVMLTWLPEGPGISEARQGIQRACVACAAGGALCPKCSGDDEIQLKPLTRQIAPLVQRQESAEEEEEEDESVIQPKRDSGSVIQQLDEEEKEETIRAKPFSSQSTPLAQRQDVPEEEEEEETIQAKQVPSWSSEATPRTAPRIQPVGDSGQPLPESTRAFLEPRFGYDFSQVRVHTDTHAAESARALNAQAFTVYRDVVFGAGKYAPETIQGKRLIAHELTHVVQQTSTGSSRSGTIQRRRVPAGVGLGATIPAAGAGFAAHREGLVRALRRAWTELTSAQRATIRTNAAAFGITGATDAALFAALATASQAQLLSFSDEFRLVRPDLTLGDPALIDTGARPATADTANIAALVANADAVFSTIASGVRDADLTAVFGAANVAAAKTKYAAARTRMNALHGLDKIVTDRSGYYAEAGVGGLTNASQISVHPSVIDNPAFHESVLTLIHESMHAGNTDVHDDGYITQPSFTALAATRKLTNAAHYEVVPNRILRPAHHDAFAGQTFIPAGTTVSGVTAPPLTPTQRAIRNTSEAFRGAWTVGLNLHRLFVRVFRNPLEWATLDLAANFSGAQAGSRFSTTLPFWSKVEKLTIHERTGSITPAAGPPKAPVTLIDISLSEGLTRKLSQGMNGVPQTPAVALSFERAHLSTPEVTTATSSISTETRVLKRLVLRHVTGRITGTVGRDYQVLKRMANTSRAASFTEYLKIRGLADFPF